MGTSKNKTRQTLFPVAIHKPIKEGIELRDGIFVSLENGYIIPATPSTVIEGIAVNDVYNKEQIKEPATEGHDRMCIYFPKRRWETFTMEVQNGEITQEDVGQTFLIVGELQHINYATKAERGGQFRLEQVITPTKGEFTYYFDSSLSPQGPKGDDGKTPTFTFQPVQTLPVGSPANLIVDPQGDNYDLTFQIPAGANGQPGGDGLPGPKGDDGETIDLQIGEVTGGQTPAANIRTVSPTMRELDLTLPKGKDGEDGLSPTPRSEWSSAYTYEYLDIVRYPDQDGVGCSWIWKFRDTPSTSTDIPGESDGWMLLNVDGANGEQGEPGGTIVVPVEGRPGKDGNPGTPGEPGKDGISPHDEGNWVPGNDYSPLSMVRATTGTYDDRGNEIFAYYITNNGTSSTTEPKDSSAWSLVVKDGEAGDGNRWSAMVFLNEGKTQTGEFDPQGNGTPRLLVFDGYTGNREMVSDGGVGITITKTGHYRVYGHMIVQNNTGTYKYINLGRASIFLRTNRGSSDGPVQFLATAKQGGPYSTTQGPWLDLTMNCEVDLYEGDLLALGYRPQTDTNQRTSQEYEYIVHGADDPTGDVSTGSLGGRFATYLGVCRISKLTPQSGETNKISGNI